jgi:hypothetical protein
VLRGRRPAGAGRVRVPQPACRRGLHPGAYRTDGGPGACRRRSGLRAFRSAARRGERLRRARSACPCGLLSRVLRCHACSAAPRYRGRRRGWRRSRGGCRPAGPSGVWARPGPAARTGSSRSPGAGADAGDALPVDAGGVALPAIPTNRVVPFWPGLLPLESWADGRTPPHRARYHMQTERGPGHRAPSDDDAGRRVPRGRSGRSVRLSFTAVRRRSPPPGGVAVPEARHQLVTAGLQDERVRESHVSPLFPRRLAGEGVRAVCPSSLTTSRSARTASPGRPGRPAPPSAYRAHGSRGPLAPSAIGHR